MRNRRTPFRSCPHRRAGYLYVAVMAVATVVSIVGLCAITVARASLRSAQDESDRYEACVLALSAIENGLAAINTNPAWRTTYTLGVEFPSTAHSLGGGTISCKLDDPDGNLVDDTSDPAILYGVGRVRDAVHVRKVQIEPNGSGAEMKIAPGSWEDAEAP